MRITRMYVTNQDTVIPIRLALFQLFAGCYKQLGGRPTNMTISALLGKLLAYLFQNQSRCSRLNIRQLLTNYGNYSNVPFRLSFQSQLRLQFICKTNTRYVALYVQLYCYYHLVRFLALLPFHGYLPAEGLIAVVSPFQVHCN